jgi:hypothetical protein
MKSLFFSTVFKFLTFSIVFAFPLLMSFSPVRVPESRPIDLHEAEMRKLVDNAFEDSLFKLINASDIKRFLGNIQTMKSISKEEWIVLAKKKNLSIQETENIFSLFGFSDLKDYDSYVDLLVSLSKKYGIDKMSEDDQKRFFESLRKKQDNYILDNKLLEKEFIKYVTPKGGGMPSECWKCVYDYRDCINANPSVVISYTTETTTTRTYIYATSGTSAIMQTTYTQYSNPQIDYINTSYSPLNCHDIYRSCISSCATP